VRQLTPFVGREEEMAMLMRRWERARQGDGQFVLIVGEPGLGKSRLIEEFHGRLRDTPHTWLEWSCSQLLQNTPLHLFDILPYTILATSPILTGVSSKISCAILSHPIHKYRALAMGTARDFRESF
jgi:hypothetical protein